MNNKTFHFLNIGIGIVPKDMIIIEKSSIHDINQYGMIERLAWQLLRSTHSISDFNKMFSNAYRKYKKIHYSNVYVLLDATLNDPKPMKALGALGSVLKTLNNMAMGIELDYSDSMRTIHSLKKNLIVSGKFLKYSHEFAKLVHDEQCRKNKLIHIYRILEGKVFGKIADKIIVSEIKLGIKALY